MAKIFAKPGIDKRTSEPLRLRDPATLVHIPAEGALVELDMVTRRRLRDGDLVEATQPSAVKSPANEPAPAPAAKAPASSKDKG